MSQHKHATLAGLKYLARNFGRYAHTADELFPRIAMSSPLHSIAVDCFQLLVSYGRRIYTKQHAHRAVCNEPKTPSGTRG